MAPDSAYIYRHRRLYNNLQSTGPLRNETFQTDLPIDFHARSYTLEHNSKDVYPERESLLVQALEWRGEYVRPSVGHLDLLPRRFYQSAAVRPAVDNTRRPPELP